MPPVTATPFPTATPSPTPTVALSPTVVASPPPVTPTTTVTASPTPGVEEPTQPQDDGHGEGHEEDEEHDKPGDLALELRAHPRDVRPGQPFSLRWEVKGKTGEGWQLIIQAPPGFLPLADEPGKHENDRPGIQASNPLTLPLEREGAVVWQVPADARPPYAIQVRLWDGAQSVLTRTLTLPETDDRFPIHADQDEHLRTGDGELELEVPAGVFTQSVTIEVYSLDGVSAPPPPLSDLAYRLLAWGPDGEEVHHFEAPLTLRIHYPEHLWGARESALRLYYYDPQVGDWLPLPGRVDTAQHVLIVQTDHFTDVSVGLEDVQEARLPDLTAADVEGYSGAAQYSLPLEVPPGPGGLQPTLRLQYHGAVVDRATRLTQAAWVGLGWSLDVPYVERNLNGTYNELGDDTFVLHWNGLSELLVQDAQGRYHTRNEAFLRIEYDPAADTWTVWDGEGTQYVFADRATYPLFDDLCDYGGQVPWRWSLTQVQNRFGQALTYDYEKEVEWVHFCNRWQRVDRAVYPRSIRYPHGRYRVFFERVADRQDYQVRWAGAYSLVLFGKSRLAAVRMEQDADGDGVFETVMREYRLQYAPPAQALFPGRVWSAGGRTLTLVGVQQMGAHPAGAMGPTLPAIQFTYADGMHLSAVDNGYGGRVSFQYAPLWHALVTDEDHTWKQEFGQYQQPCEWRAGDPYYGSTGGWQGNTVYDEVFCYNGALRMRNRGGAQPTTEVYKDLPEAWTREGGVYRLTWTVSTRWGWGWVRVGLDDGLGHVQWSPQYNMDHYGGQWQAFFSLPAGASHPRLRIQCYDAIEFAGDSAQCEMNFFQVELLPVKVRVERKTVDNGKGQVDPFVYRYDEPAVNDAAHSAWAAGGGTLLVNPNSADRGHAATEVLGPDGRLQVRWYAQDDFLQGQVVAGLTASETFYDPFDAWPTSAWTTGPGMQVVHPRQDGDPLLRLSNDGSRDWPDVRRTQMTIGGAQGATAVWLTFRFSDTAPISGTVLALEANASASDAKNNHRWGLFVQPGGVATAQWSDGNGWSDTALAVDGSAFTLRKGVWYTLLLVLEGDRMGLWLWPREHTGQTLVTYERQTTTPPDGPWFFRVFVTGDTEVELDDYHEGRVYRLDWSQYQVITDTLTLGTPPGPYASGGYRDWRRYRVQVQEQRTYHLEGGADWWATRTQWTYDDYGNPTHRLESAAAAGSAWQPERLTLWGYFPRDDAGHYLVGLPAFENVYDCRGGGCALSGYPPASRLLSSHQYLYDGATTYDRAPTQGVLTGERLLLGCQLGTEVVPCAEAGYQHWRYHDTAYAYDAWGNRTAVTVYAGYGSLAAYGQGQAWTETTAYDPVYHTYPVSQTNAAGHTTTRDYDATLGRVTRETDPNGAITTYAYDPFGRLIAVRRPGDEQGRATLEVSYTSTLGLQVDVQQKIDEQTVTHLRLVYDGLGRKVQQRIVGALVDGQTTDVVVDYVYDAYGRVIRQTMPYTASQTTITVTQTTYDLLGRVRTVQAPDGTTTHYTYALSQGLLTVAVTDPNGQITYREQDAWGRLVAVRPPLGPEVTYHYDPLGRLTAVAYAGATRVQLVYDEGGRKVRLSDADMGLWRYAYDARGNLIRQMDARGCVISLSYDGLNRLTGRQYSGPGACATTPAVTYTYDQGVNGVGRRTRMDDGSGYTTWAYDARGRVVRQTKGVNGVGTFVTQWTYYSNDAVHTQTYPGGPGGGLGETVTFTYLPQGLLDGLVGQATYVQDTAYDAAGRMVQRTLGQGALTTEMTYYAWGTSGGRLRRIQTGSLQDLSYTYDAVGNVSSVQDDGDTLSFTYDGLNRLTGVSGAVNQGYGYDTLGRLSSKAGQTLTYGDPAHLHAVTALSNGNTYAYDANGNQVTRVVGGVTYELTYDAGNRLVEVTRQEVVTGGGGSGGGVILGASGSGRRLSLGGATTDGFAGGGGVLPPGQPRPTTIATFTYDGDGQRVKAALGSVTTVFIGGYYEWHSDGTTVQYYLAGSQRVAMRKNGALYFLLADHLGSTRVTTDAQGNSVAEMRYEPWGETRYTQGAMPTDYTFTGQYSYADSFGLMYYRARWYDPALGHFAQADTIVPGAGNPLAWDRYAYTLNNPLKYIDPRGHEPWWCTDGNCVKTYYDGCLVCLHTPPQRPHPRILETLRPNLKSLVPASPRLIWESAPPLVWENAPTSSSPASQQPDTAISPGNMAKGLGVLNSSLDLAEMLPYIHVPGAAGVVLDATAQWVSDAGLDLSPAQRAGRIAVAVGEGQLVAYSAGAGAAAIGASYIETGPGAFVAFAGAYVIGNVVISEGVDFLNETYVFPFLGFSPGE